MFRYLLIMPFHEENEKSEAETRCDGKPCLCNIAYINTFHMSYRPPPMELITTDHFQNQIDFP